MLRENMKLSKTMKVLMIKDLGAAFDTALSKRLFKMMELAMDLEWY